MNTEAAEPGPTVAKQDVKKVTDEISAAFRLAWLAVLGAPVAAAEGGGELFNHLVQRGEKVEHQGRQHLRSMGESVGRAARTVSSAVGETFKEVGKKARSFAGKSEEAFDHKVAEKLKAMGVPTKKDIEDLHRRVDEIAAKLEKLQTPR